MSYASDLTEIRSRYLAHAIERVARLAVRSKMKARCAAQELKRYLDGVQDRIPAQDKRRYECELRDLLQRKLR